MKYTAEEVRAHARMLRECRINTETTRDRQQDKLADICDAYADLLERIKADESAVPAAWQYRYKNDRMQWSRWVEWVPEEHPEAPFPKMIGRWEVEYRKLFIHPPAQAAQDEASPGRCKACGRATRAVCDGLDGNGLGCTNAPPIDIAATQEGEG